MYVARAGTLRRPLRPGKSFLPIGDIGGNDEFGGRDPRSGPAGLRFRDSMDLHVFDLNLLVALDALLAERSVTNAGRRVHLSQSAMSGVLARLRHAFNDKLLVASRGGMTLTPLAESLVDPVRSILEQIHRTI